MDDGEYNSVADRQKASQSRVHSDLTERCRERLAHLTLNPLRIRVTNLEGKGAVPNHLIITALNRTYEDVGYSTVNTAIYESEETENPDQDVVRKARMSSSVSPSIQNRINQAEENLHIEYHKNLIQNGERDAVLAYIEHLMESVANSGITDWSDTQISLRSVDRGERTSLTTKRINTALETEGILWKFENNGKKFNFQPIGSEFLEEADHEFLSVTEGTKWAKVVSPYDRAFELYRDRVYGHEIPEKLYNSIEELAKTICVDLRGWEDNRNQNLSVYLELMRQNGLFEPNNIMMDELKDLSTSMERTFQKAGAERKNRHSEIDREYATLILHQVSAYLTYLIRRYEEKFGEVER
ncbi:MAG: hypothetical protein U5J98_06760 [Halobacteriales archaeon]|nr:hypothetical protein [Halobacteriales archaeon]